MSGAEVSLPQIVDKVYLPGKAGSLQLEMLAATRTSGRLPYVVDGSLGALWEELSAGRPVVVLQNLGIAAIPTWHYAVVVGIDPAEGRVILRSGTDRRRVTAIDVFLRTWQRSGYWGMVVLRADEMPARVDRSRYFGAIAALEQAGRPDEAATAWNTALRAWPGDPVALFGLGNAHLANGNAAEAETLYRALLAQDERQVVARNNLALALARQAKFEQALAAIEAALADNDDPALEAELLDTRATIAAAARRD